MSDLPKDAFRALTYVPGDDQPNEWITQPTLCAVLTDLHGPELGSDSKRLLNMLRRRGHIVRRRGQAPGTDTYRRTPSGSRVLAARGSGER